VTTPAPFAGAATNSFPDPHAATFPNRLALAGAASILSVMYGFAAERLDYRVTASKFHRQSASRSRRHEIVQLSDIHLSGYMSRTDVAARSTWPMSCVPICRRHRRFHHWSLDPPGPIASRKSVIFRAPGVFGATAITNLMPVPKTRRAPFAQAGMKLLRHENVQLPSRRPI